MGIAKRFVTNTDSAKEERVVSSSLVMISSALIQAEKPFHLNPVNTVPISFFHGSGVCSFRPPKLRPGHSDAVFLAILKVRPRAIDLIRQDPFWIMSRAFSIPLDGVFQNEAFMIRGERDLLQARSREKAAFLERFAPNEVLEIGILADLLHQPAVRQLLPLLDNNAPQRHAERLGRMSCLRREQLVVTGLLLYPVPVSCSARRNHSFFGSSCIPQD